MQSAAHDQTGSDIAQLKDTVLRQQRQIEELGAQLARSSAEKTDLLRRARVEHKPSAIRSAPPAPAPRPLSTLLRLVRLNITCAPMDRMRRWAERSSCAA